LVQVVEVEAKEDFQDLEHFFLLEAGKEEYTTQPQQVALGVQAEAVEEITTLQTLAVLE
jgi:hypothetical protein